MGRTHLLVGAGVALTAFVFVGCAAKPKSVARQQLGQGQSAQGPIARGKATGQHAAVTPDAPQPQDAAGSAVEVTPKSIAHHTQAYAQNLESLLAKRTGSAARPAEPAPPATSPAPPPDGAAAAANSVLKVEPQSSEKVLQAPNGKAPAPDVTGPPSPAANPKAADELASQPAPRTSPRPPVSVAPLTDSFAQKLSTRAKEYPRDAAAQFEYQILQFLRDEPVPDLGGIAPLPAEDRELLAALLDGLSNFRNGLRAEANMLQSKKVAPLLEMGDRLRGLGELTIPTAALCNKVDRFGVYDPMEPAHLKAGTNNEAVLYCEVANFSSQLNTAKQWETRLKLEAVLYNETGLNVWTAKGDPVSDVSRNRRHDFYVVKRLRVPPMPIGRYLLKVTVTDVQISRVAEATVPLQVVAGQ